MADERARQLRRSSTDVERRLWAKLRNSQLDGYKFRRQHPVGNYVVDCACEQAGLVVELDGGQHAEAVAADAHRTAYLNQRGFRVLRFWNNEVTGNLEVVLDAILAELRRKF
jgi:very-short-patch-repair endonuclease